MAENETVQQEEGNEENPSLGVVDIQNCLQIIDVAATRGAFRGNELSQVGQVRDKVSAFLESVLPKEEGEGEEADTQAEAPAEEEAPKTASKRGGGRRKSSK